MTKPSQKESIKINLQLFSGEDDVVEDNIEDDIEDDNKSDDIPVEDDVSDTIPEDDNNEPEEFDEIVYNKEPVKIPKKERQTYLQKGYNYDKVHGKLTEFETKAKKLSELTGMDIDSTIEYLENQRIEQETQQYAVKNGITEEQAKKELARDKEIQSLKTEVNKTKFMSTVNEQKKALKEQPFFNELEKDIDDLVTETISKGQNIDVETAYIYLRGKKLPELLENAKKNTAKSTIAEMQDIRRRGGVLKNDGGGEDVDISDVDISMAKAFGNDPKDIAKYKKSKMKR